MAQYTVLHEGEPVYMQCKSFFHPWRRFQPVDPIRGVDRRSEAVISFVCEECGNEKHVIIHRTSGEARTRYKRSKEFMSQTMGKDWYRREWRMAFVRQFERNGHG